METGVELTLCDYAILIYSFAYLLINEPYSVTWKNFQKVNININISMSRDVNEDRKSVV